MTPNMFSALGKGRIVGLSPTVSQGVDFGQTLASVLTEKSPISGRVSGSASAKIWKDGDRGPGALEATPRAFQALVSG